MLVAFLSNMKSMHPNRTMWSILLCKGSSQPPALPAAGWDAFSVHCFQLCFFPPCDLSWVWGFFWEGGEIIYLFTTLLQNLMQTFSYDGHFPKACDHRHRMVWGGRDLKDRPVPTPLPGAGTPSIRPQCSKFHPAWPWTVLGWGIHDFSGQTVAGLLDLF